MCLMMTYGTGSLIAMQHLELQKRIKHIEIPGTANSDNTGYWLVDEGDFYAVWVNPESLYTAQLKE